MRLMIDSGAYSVKGAGARIDLGSYIAFLKEHESVIDVAVNLDVIPPDPYAGKELVDAYAEASYCNQQRMKDAGLHPMPVFHQGERLHWLDKMLEDGEQYIGIAPYRKDRDRAIVWCGDCLAIIGKSARVHGFGLVAEAFVERYPWTSVDASTWIKRSIFGQIPVPREVDGRLDYSSPDYIAVTERSRHQDLHLDLCPLSQQAFVKRYLRDVIGIELSEIQKCPSESSFAARCKCWILYLKDLERRTGVRIYFVTNPIRTYTKILNEHKVEHRLLSYCKLRAKGAFTKYVNGR